MKGIAKIIAACYNIGFKMTVSYDEFYDFFNMMKRRVKGTECVVVISVPKNPPVGILNSVRVLCDNSIGSITNVDADLENTVAVYIIDVKPDRRKEYAVDYATKLLG